MEEIKKKIIGFFLAIVFIFAVPLSVMAASLGVSPASISKNVGDSFSVTAYIASADQAANAASGTITFPGDKLQVTGVSKAGSVMNLWVAEPSYSNADGVVRFEAIALNPGFTGAWGNILTISFKTIAAGTANISYSGGSVLANDGMGTDILKGRSGATVNIAAPVAPEVPPPAPEKPPLETPPTTEPSKPLPQNAIEIVSNSHPDQNKWFANNTPEFSWKLPVGTLEIRTLIGQLETGTPSIRYMPPITSKVIDALPDGTYYFSLQARTPEGWGEVSRYKVNVDTAAPEAFAVTVTSPAAGVKPAITFSTTDSGSGIDHYEVQYGNDAPITVEAGAAGTPLEIPLRSGGYDIKVVAVDGAGNTATATATVVMEKIEAPQVTYTQNQIDFGDLLKVGGKSAADTDVYLLVRKSRRLISREYGHTDSLGNFTVIGAKRLDPGTYSITAIAVKSNEMIGPESAAFELKVNNVVVKTTANLIEYIVAGWLVLCVAYVLLRVWIKLHQTVGAIAKPKKTRVRKVAAPKKI